MTPMIVSYDSEYVIRSPLPWLTAAGRRLTLTMPGSL